MGITPIEPPRPIAQPEIAPIPPPSLRGARDGPLRIVVWFDPAVALPDEDEILCTPDTADALFGPGIAQRLLITPETAWLQRLLPGDLAAALDETSDRGQGDVIRSTPYTHIYLLRLTGGDVGHVCDVIGAGPNVRLAYLEPAIAPTGVPTQYQASPIFKADQAYLRTPNGINAEPAWAKGYTGLGIQAGVVDLETGFNSVSYTPRRVPVPLPKGAAASSTVSSHGQIMAGLVGWNDNANVGIGAAPDVSLVFAGAQITAGPQGTPLAAPGATVAAIGEMLRNGQLKAGDVVSMSLAVFAGLDIMKPYPEYATLLQGSGTAWTLLTEKDGRPSGVVTQVPLEFDAAVFKLITDFTAKGITVVMSAGNGIQALCKPKPTRNTDWAETRLGANVGGPWIMLATTPWPGTVKNPVGAFRGTFTKTPVSHLLDRADVATFNDGGGIVVSGGFLSPTSGMIDNTALNHGNRVDCYATILTAQNLGFGANSTALPPGGTSLDTPVIAGVAAIVQQIVTTQFKGVLKPAIIRALLSDPDFGTSTVSPSAQVGVMPDLEKLMTFLRKPQGKRADLLAAVQGQQKKSAARATAAKVGASVASGSYVHDPYLVFTRPAKGPGSWSPLPLAAESDLFAP